MSIATARVERARRHLARQHGNVLCGCQRRPLLRGRGLRRRTLLRDAVLEFLRTLQRGQDWRLLRRQRAVPEQQVHARRLLGRSLHGRCPRQSRRRNPATVARATVADTDETGRHQQCTDGKGGALAAKTPIVQTNNARRWQAATASAPTETSVTTACRTLNVRRTCARTLAVLGASASTARTARAVEPTTMLRALRCVPDVGFDRFARLARSTTTAPRMRSATAATARSETRPTVTAPVGSSAPRAAPLPIAWWARAPTATVLGVGNARTASRRAFAQAAPTASTVVAAPRAATARDSARAPTPGHCAAATWTAIAASA